MKCAHCHAPNANNLWQPQLCADGRTKRNKRLCDQCDEKLNRLALEFFNDKKADEKMSKYTEKNRSPQPPSTNRKDSP